MSIRSTFPAGRGILSSWTPWYRCMEHCGWLGMLLLLAGCAHSPIVESWRQAAANQPSFEEINADPEAFTGQKVILGGEVARAKFQPEVAEIEIWQKRLDSGDRPEESFGPSQGRFLVRCTGALDPADYFRGSPITVAGEIQGGLSVKRKSGLCVASTTSIPQPATRWSTVPKSTCGPCAGRSRTSTSRLMVRVFAGGERTATAIPIPITISLIGLICHLGNR